MFPLPWVRVCMCVCVHMWCRMYFLVHSLPGSQLVADWENNDNAGAMRSRSERTTTLFFSIWLTQIAPNGQSRFWSNCCTPNGQSMAPRPDLSNCTPLSVLVPTRFIAAKLSLTTTRNHGHWWNSHKQLQKAVLVQRGRYIKQFFTICCVF